MRRALVEQTDEAWSVLEQCFRETIRRWIYSHPSSDVALLRDSEENYIAQTFIRFWYAVRDQSIWDSIQSLLPDERERRLVYLLYYCGLKPRDIVLRCPGEFDDVKDIYRLNSNIVQRLRRNRERLQYVLGGGS